MKLGKICKSILFTICIGLGASSHIHGMEPHEYDHPLLGGLIKFVMRAGSLATYTRNHIDALVSFVDGYPEKVASEEGKAERAKNFETLKKQFNDFLEKADKTVIEQVIHEVCNLCLILNDLYKHPPTKQDVIITSLLASIMPLLVVVVVDLAIIIYAVTYTTQALEELLAHASQSCRNTYADFAATHMDITLYFSLPITEEVKRHSAYRKYCESNPLKAREYSLPNPTKQKKLC